MASTTVSEEALAVAELLDAARELMNDDGSHWTRRHYERHVDGEVQHCAIGGLEAVACTRIRHSYSYERGPLTWKHVRRAKKRAILAARALAVVVGDPRVEQWNDETARDWLDVEAAFKTSAAMLRKGTLTVDALTPVAKELLAS